MSCTYCEGKTLTRVANERHQVCRCCLALTRGGHWDRLAKRWLEHRPHDWSGDVAAFLEVLHGQGGSPTAQEPR
jgi:hypothetical protein